MFAPKCGGCARAILENYISALNSLWHPECFVCRVSVCVCVGVCVSMQLIEATECVYIGRLYQLGRFA